MKYNLKSLQCSRIVELWRKATGGSQPHLAAILESSTVAADLLFDIIRRSTLEEVSQRELIDRVKHFIAENNEIVRPAGLALERSDFAALGELVDRSQHLAEVWLGTQIPETMFLAKAAPVQSARRVEFWHRLRRCGMGADQCRWRGRLY